MPVRCSPGLRPGSSVSSSPACAERSAYSHPVQNLAQDRPCHEQGGSARVHVIIRDGTASLASRENRRTAELSGGSSLKSKLRGQHAGREPILDLLIKKNWLVSRVDSPDTWTTSGWLKEITDLRNEIVHRRPYGSVYCLQSVPGRHGSRQQPVSRACQRTKGWTNKKIRRSAGIFHPSSGSVWYMAAPPFF